MINQPSPQQTNTLGKASLGLGVVSAALVFGIGLCALVGAFQGWALNPVVSTPLFVCGASSAFLGFLGAILGFAGLFGPNRSRSASIVGLILGASGACLFAFILIALGAIAGG